MSADSTPPASETGSFRHLSSSRELDSTCQLTREEACARLAAVVEGRCAKVRHPGRKRHVMRGVLALSLLILLGVAGLGFALFRLQSDENSAFLREHFTDLVTRSLGPGHELTLQTARVEFSGLRPRFTLGGLVVRNTQTKAEARLKQASFALSMQSLWRLSPEARVVRFSGLDMVLPEAGVDATTLQAQEILALIRGGLGGIHIALSGDDPAFAALRLVEGREISLFRLDERGQGVPLQTGLEVSLARGSAGEFTARIHKEGIEPLLMRAQAEDDPGDGRQIVLSSGDVQAGTLFALLGAPIAGVDPKLMLGLRMTTRLTPDGGVNRSGISISARGGRIELPDPDMVPFLLDEAVLDLSVVPGNADLHVDRLLVRFNETHIEASGVLTPQAAGAGGIGVQLTAKKALLDRLSAKEDVVELDALQMRGILSADLASFELEALDIAEDGGRAHVAGRFSIANGGLIQTRLEANGLLLRKALRIWPIWIAPNVRQWLVEHVQSGRAASLVVVSDLAGEALHNAFAKKPVPDNALAVNFSVEDAVLAPLPDALPLTEASVRGVVTGRHATIELVSAKVPTPKGSALSLGPARLVVADTSRRPATLDMTIPVSGKVDALLSFLAAPSLRNLTGLPVDVAVPQGDFSALAQISQLLSAKPQPRDTQIDIKANMTNVVVENIIKGQKIEEGSFTLLSKAGQTSLKGKAMLFGAPALIEFKVEGKTATAQLKTTLDDAALAKRGLDLRPMLKGPLAVTASLKPGAADAPVTFEVDLARAKIAAPVPGMSKAAGAAGKAKFTLSSIKQGGRELSRIEGLELDFGTMSLRGKLDVGDGGVQSADFSTFKLSPGDKARLSVERAGKGYTLGLKGNSFDARPFLRSVQSGRIESGGNPVDFDLDLATTVIVGFGGELMSGADLKLSRRAGELSQINLKGQFSGDSVRVTSESAGKNLRLKVTTGDGGALARFLDLYSRAHGGDLNADITLSPQGGQQGNVQMRNFVLRGENGLRSVSANAQNAQAVVGNQDNVPFDRLKASFTRRPGRVDVHEAVMWGPQVGGSLEGMIDYAKDVVSIKGTFVPAYALNNLFAKVPLLGPILGGGQYEGLFAVPFIITGKASAPVLRTNPVSVIAPGFLRKIFEIRKESQ